MTILEALEKYKDNAIANKVNWIINQRVTEKKEGDDIVVNQQSVKKEEYLKAIQKDIAEAELIIEAIDDLIEAQGGRKESTLRLERYENGSD